MTHFIAHYGLLALFLWVFLEQLGAPLPSVPVLLAAGALSATHAMGLWGAIFAVLTSSLLADSVGFYSGRRYGSKVTRWLCKFSLEEASCVRKAEDTIAARGPYALLIAKFVPGLNLMASPLAGHGGIRYRTFFLYDAAGTLLWGGAFLLLGRSFGDVLRKDNLILQKAGRSALIVFVLLVVGVLAAKIWRRQSFLRKVRTMRISPEDVKAMMDRGEEVYIVDLRHPMDYLPDPRVLPGAVRMLPQDLVSKNAELPRDRDIVVYCTCPSEATSAQMALAMRRLGVERVRPLRGGFDAWKKRGYPLVETEAAPVP